MNQILLFISMVMLVICGPTSSSYGAQSAIPYAQSSDFFRHTSKIAKIADLKDKLQEGDVLLLDIDDTILTHQKVFFWKTAQEIEENIGKIIKSLQKKGVIVLCLTARSWHRRVKKTHKQMRKIGIDLTDAIQVRKIPNFPYKNGVIYASPPAGMKSIKGPVFKEFLDYFLKNAQASDQQVISKNYFAISRIKRVIFDKIYNIQIFMATLPNDPTYRHIEFYGLHFVPEKALEKKSMPGKGIKAPSLPRNKTAT
jgi:hypothetical protein